MLQDLSVLHEYLERIINDAVPGEEACLNDEEECFRRHPIHLAGSSNGRMYSIYADVTGLIDIVLDAIGKVYLSTGCMHGEHEHCRCGVTLSGDPKTPGTCKFCPAVCICACHRDGADLNEQDLSPYMHHDVHHETAPRTL